VGHRTPAMSLRYAQHAPEPYGDDADARIEASMAGWPTAKYTPQSC